MVTTIFITLKCIQDLHEHEIYPMEASMLLHAVHHSQYHIT